MADEKTLKDCPFCGGSAEIGTNKQDEHGNWSEKQVGCSRCSAVGGYAYSDGELEDCIKAWNIRPASTPAIPASVEDAFSAIEYFMRLHGGNTVDKADAHKGLDTLRQSLLTAATSSQSLRDETFETIATEAVADCDILVNRCTALETENTALRERVKGMEAALNDYLRKCDFHGNRVLSKPMPADADIHRFKQAVDSTYRGKEASDG